MDFKIRTLLRSDWESVLSIYLEGIATGEATFETDAPAYAAWDSAHLPGCRVSALIGDELVGWAALSPVSSRCVYRGVAEVSIYVAAAHRGEGIGRALLEALIARSEEEGIWTLESSMFPENEASIRLHETCGFRQVGFREKIAAQHGRWRDTVLMERRSRVSGLAAADILETDT